MEQSYGEIKQRSFGVLLDREGHYLQMDLRGPLSETFECAPEHAYRTAKKLDDAYEGALSEPWDVEYTLESDHVFASLSKQYGEPYDLANSPDIAVNPAQNVFVSPIDDTGLEVEIRGVMDISPERFLRLVES